MQLKEKVVVVTGGGNGVGRELVLMLLKKDAIVAAVDLDKNALNEVVNLTGESAKLSIHCINIADQIAVNSLVDEVVECHEHIDAIINCAGIIQPFINVDDIEFEKINKVMDVNFFGTLYMTKAFLPVLKQQPEAYIANVSSMGGFFPVPGQSIYGASKAAVKLLTEGLYAELHGTNVGVSVIIPGGIATNIMNNSNIGEQGADMNTKGINLLLTPGKAAKLIIKCIEKDKFRVYIGKDAKLFNILYKFYPKLAIRTMKRVLALQ